MTNDESGESIRLTTEQAYEAAYRFVMQYYDRARIDPLFLMIHSMGWRGEHEVTNDPASWPEWQECVRQTLDAEPLPELRAPTR